MNRIASSRAKAQRQRGVTMAGLLLWAFLVATVAGVIIKVVPVVNEYRTLLTMINRLAEEGGESKQAIMAKFNRYKQTQYGIESVNASDLDISKENDKLVIAFAYAKEIELVGPVSLLIHFEGKSK